MDERQHKEKRIEDCIVDRNNDCTYKKIEKKELAKRFPCVLDIYENRVRDNHSYTIEEVRNCFVYSK